MSIWRAVAWTLAAWASVWFATYSLVTIFGGGMAP